MKADPLQWCVSWESNGARSEKRTKGFGSSTLRKRSRSVFDQRP